MEQLGTKRQITILLFTSLLAVQFFAFAATAAPEKAADSLTAVNRALEQALNERAKSQREFERNASAGRPRESAMMRKQHREERANEKTDDRLVVRGDSRLDQDSRETRAQSRDDRGSERRDRREDTRRERRLNWLND